jgi:tripartite-type tricarboxylate transporter receptor subunit TctC
MLTAIVAMNAATLVQSASAQTYPTKPIHLIVFPYPAGGGTDFFARVVGPTHRHAQAGGRYTPRGRP